MKERSSNLFDYPNYLNKIFDKLKKNEIKSIIVGGYVRDFFLNLESKDIDIELFGVNSYQELENILKEFGAVNNVGKSFGVCKLSLKNLEIDFTLPRSDNKIASGHSGFLVKTDKNLDFKRASSRRDFTMNSIGYDIDKKIFLDPFDGIKDIKNKCIKAVDLKKFDEDPLRVFRAVSFYSRLEFKLDEKLFLLCQNMCEKNLLFELAKERVYDEIKKIFLKSPQPSSAFILLKELGGLKYLQPLDALDAKDFLSIMNTLDRIKQLSEKEKATNFFLMLSVICYKFNKNDLDTFLFSITNKTNLAKNIASLTNTKFEFYYTDSKLLHLATQVNIELFLLFSQAHHPLVNAEIFSSIKKRAKHLGILNSKQENLLKGRDIINLGIKPSKEYSHILNKAYEEQLDLKIQTRAEALIWLKKYLL